MGRKKLYQIRILLPLPTELLAQIDATLQSGEYRVDFIREALKRELERRVSKRGRRKRH
jgi:Arc/MetJ-type ribon-helix-helix transcriptional regulator